MRRALLTLVVAGCSFDPGSFTTDGAVTSDRGGGDVDNDEDGVVDTVDNCPTISNGDQRNYDDDVHGDACDGCPHRASTTDPDGDGDGVGDDCDPRPAQAGDQRAYWLAFYDPTDIASWNGVNTPTAQWQVVNGKLEQANPTAGFYLLDSPQPLGETYFEVRAEIVTTANEIGFCAADIPIGAQYYCCGAYVNGQPGARAVSAWSGSGGQIVDPDPFPAGTAGETFDMIGEMTPTGFSCLITKGPTTVTMGTTRGPMTPGTAVFYTTVQSRYHYAFVVAIGS